MTGGEGTTDMAAAKSFLPPTERFISRRVVYSAPKHFTGVQGLELP